MKMVKLGDIAKQIRGVSYGKSDVQELPEDGYFPVLRANNITEDGLVFDNLVYVTSKKISEKQKLKSGDILIAASSGSLSVVGKAAQATIDYNGSFGAFCKVVRPSSKVHSGYIGHFFRTQSYRRKMSELAAGANINNLKNEHIDNLDIPLPPLEEQKRIAAVLDQADALRRQRQHALNRLNQLGQAIFYEMFGDPISNSRSIKKAALGSIIKVSSGEGLTSANQSGGKYPVYGGNGINGWHDQFLVEPNTIVIGRVGAYCGSVHVTNCKSWVTDNALIVTKKDAGLNTTYLSCALLFANLNQYAGRSSQPLISGSRIYPIEIPLPEDSEQIKFERLFSAVQEKEEIYSKALLSQETLFSALQHRAFQGEL